MFFVLNEYDINFQLVQSKLKIKQYFKEIMAPTPPRSYPLHISNHIRERQTIQLELFTTSYIEEPRLIYSVYIIGANNAEEELPVWIFFQSR